MEFQIENTRVEVAQASTKKLHYSQKEMKRAEMWSFLSSEKRHLKRGNTFDEFFQGEKCHLEKKQENTSGRPPRFLFSF